VQGLLPFPEPERWLPVPGWERLYEVSDLGRVRSLPRKGGNNRWYGGKVLVPYPHKGYPVVPLCRGGQRTMRAIHQLVLEAFAGPCPPGMQACHNNGQPGDPGVAIQPGPVRCERPTGCDRDVARRVGWIFTKDH
jgi:NUMOD4 motif